MIEERGPPEIAPKRPQVDRTFDHLKCTAQCCCHLLQKLKIKEIPHNEEAMTNMTLDSGYKRALGRLLPPLLSRNGYSCEVLDNPKNGKMDRRELAERFTYVRDHILATKLPCIISIDYSTRDFSSERFSARTSIILEDVIISYPYSTVRRQIVTFNPYQNHRHARYEEVSLEAAFNGNALPVRPL